MREMARFTFSRENLGIRPGGPPPRAFRSHRVLISNRSSSSSLNSTRRDTGADSLQGGVGRARYQIWGPRLNSGIERGRQLPYLYKIRAESLPSLRQVAGKN